MAFHYVNIRMIVTTALENYIVQLRRVEVCDVFYGLGVVLVCLVTTHDGILTWLWDWIVHDPTGFFGAFTPVAIFTFTLSYYESQMELARIQRLEK
jgi:hypothetical protein